MTETAELWHGGSAHAALGRLRDEAPVRRVSLPNGMPVWLLTRHADVRAVLSDDRFTTLPTANADRDKVDPGLLAAMTSHMLAARGAERIRLRRLVSSAFTRRRIDELEPRIRQISDELLDRMTGRDTVDLIAEIAAPLPAIVIAELVGVPQEDHKQFIEWSRTYTASLGAPGFPVAEMTEFVGYLRTLIARKREAPDNTLLSALIAARDAELRLSDDELTSSVFLLIVAGNDTTANLIGNGMVLLLASPARMAHLRAHPETLPGVIEEILRYESPLAVTTLKVAAEPVEFGAVTVPAGEPVMLSLLSANRDPAEFADADTFQPDRPETSHLAFSLGAHYCLGAPLARLEGRLAIEALLRRHPNLRLAVTPANVRWRPGIFAHGLAELPVSLG